MHPDILRQLAAEHIRDLITEAGEARRAREARTPSGVGWQLISPPTPAGWPSQCLAGGTDEIVLAGMDQTGDDPCSASALPPDPDDRRAGRAAKCLARA